MRWSDLLNAIAAKLADDLEGYTTAVGAWARVPNIDTAHIQLARQDIEENRERTLRIHIDLFVQPPADVADALATAAKLEDAQQRTEAAVINSLPALGALTVTLKSWENDGGIFLPTWGSRLTLDVLLWHAVIAKPTNLGCYGIQKPEVVNVTFLGERDAILI